MTWDDAIDRYITDSKLYGRFTSENTARSYREALAKHAEDCAGAGPLDSTREHVKATLGRYTHPRSQFHRHSILTSFYDWLTVEDLREGNPARKVQRARVRHKSGVYRLTRAEVTDLMDVCANLRETRLIHIGLLTGGRVSELSQLRVRHFQRRGFVLFSEDIAKGGVARWVPALPELEPIVQDILATVDPDEYVIRQQRDYGPQPISRYALNKTMKVIAARAKIPGNLTVHTLRHAFGDHIARFAGLRVAQALMGHSSPVTTAQIYTSAVGLDELAGAVSTFAYRDGATPVPRSNATYLSDGSGCVR